MRGINDIYEAIDANGFKESTLQLIDEYINDIENGRANFSRFNEQEHAGLCKAGPTLIGASIIASYVRRSITSSCDAEGREGGPANWEIDEKQEQIIEQWAKAVGLWFANSESPYVRCLRLATKEEIDDLVFAKGFRDNWSGQGVNYISDRIALEDMHPANVFIDEISSKPICIDCIVKFV